MAMPAYAGSTAHAEPQFESGQIVSFAKKVEKVMAGKGARVFILARAGRPASDMPDGFEYTHVAFGVYSMIKTNDGRTLPGYAIYNLYQDDKRPDISHLVTDYPVDFFAGVYELKTGIIIPKPELQKRLLQVIASDTYRKLHNADYSVVANPYNSKYQNCTEYTLDVIEAALYQTDDVRLIKVNERAYFKAQPVKIPPLKLLAGILTMPDLKTTDQKGGIQTASFTTIERYMSQYGLVQEKLVITQ
ncbi:hypothetical protein SPV1_09158 [Mariprofundus ferrooxydans PV-1]|uniref:DUF2145 domain-containing protein n=2 Tax=Mariprofundus ferrooxydans TaxID=314344 RepID=Q0F033_9PROT|nr:hypothetical protein SPV1_09158 [Mariprofundus ferrooxydans PV-1]